MEPGFRRERICNMRPSAQKGGGQRWGYRPINEPVQAEKWRRAVSILLTSDRNYPLPSRTMKQASASSTDQGGGKRRTGPRRGWATFPAPRQIGEVDGPAGDARRGPASAVGTVNNALTDFAYDEGMISVSDSQLRIVATAADLLPGEARGTFLRRVVAELREGRNFNDSDVEQAVRAALLDLSEAPSP